MHKTLTLQSDYSKNGSHIQLSLPIHTETLIPVDDSVRLIDQVLEEIDYRELYLTYSSEGRNPAVSPKTLFKIMVYAYSQHIYSSREIEKACKLNLAFIYLLRGEKAPDHNTIARFRKYHLESCAEGLLTQLVELLAASNEIQFENLFIDGTKIEANANKYSFVCLTFLVCNRRRNDSGCMFRFSYLHVKLQEFPASKNESLAKPGFGCAQLSSQMV